MEDWKELPLSQLKKLVKSRAGRIAELQMEIKVLEGLIEARARSGDFGEEKKEEPKKEKVQDRPQERTVPQQPVQRPEPRPETQPSPQTFQPQQPAQRPASQDFQTQQGQQFVGQRPNVSQSSDAPQVYGSQENGNEEEEPARKKKEINTFVEL